MVHGTPDKNKPEVSGTPRQAQGRPPRQVPTLHRTTTSMGGTMGRRGRLSLSEETTFFVTTTIVGFTHIFQYDRYCDILIHNIKHYRNHYGFSIYGYVIMPTHFHWIIEVNPQLGFVHEIMRDLKKYAAWDIFEALEKDERNQMLRIFQRAAIGFKNQKRKLWMERFDDVVIRNREMMIDKLEYIHNNPVKAGLVTAPEDYQHSDSRKYPLDDHSILEVVTDW